MQKALKIPRMLLQIVLGALVDAELMLVFLGLSEDHALEKLEMPWKLDRLVFEQAHERREAVGQGLGQLALRDRGFNERQEMGHRGLERERKGGRVPGKGQIG